MNSDQQILGIMVERKIIPMTGIFDINQQMIDSFYDIYREVNIPKTNKHIRNNNIKYAKKLAGLS